MDRKEFLASLGLGTTAFVCLSALGGCNPDAPVTATPSNVDFTLDLSDPANSALKSAGGYVYKEGIIIAKTVNGTYLAVQSACTHAGTTVAYESADNRFHCPAHGSNFSTSGSVINGPASQPLKQYKTTLSGNSLRVYS